MADSLATVAAGGSEAVAVGITVVATVVVLALLVAAVTVAFQARATRRAAQALAGDAAELLATLEVAVARAGAELDRLDDLLGSAESISEVVGSASRLASTAMATPVIKVMALGSGAARAGRRLRGEAPPGGVAGTRRRLDRGTSGKG